MGSLGVALNGRPERVVPCRDLPRDLRRAAALLTYEALPAFYKPIPTVVAVEAIASEFLETGSEISGAEAAVASGEVQGILAGFPARELAARQSVGLHHIFAKLPPEQLHRFIEHLRAFSSGVPSVPPKSRYLARLAVTETQRGGGLADHLLLNFLEKSAGVAVSLHVRADNSRAIAFYARHGFRSMADNQPYLAMLRP